MTEQSTPAPALTDEQIDAQWVDIRASYVRALIERGTYYAEAFHKFDTWFAAVEARAKREERAATVAWLRNAAAGLEDPAYGSAIGWMADRLENKEDTNDTD